MSKSARTIFIFGIYLLVTSVTLLLAPNFLLRTFGLAETAEVWIRVVGVLAGVLGFLDVQTARQEMTGFFRLTVYSRSVVILFFTAFVLLGWVGAPLIVFGVVDLLGAIWTWTALRGENKWA